MMEPLSCDRRGFLAGLAAVSLLQGCGAAGSPPGGIVFGEQRSLRPIASVAGTLDETPYPFRWATFATPSVEFEAFRAGALDMASSNDITILNAAQAGVPFRIVGFTQGGLQKAVGIVVRRDLPVRSVADLKGRKIIVSSARGGSGDNMLRGALREAGLNAGDVSISYAPFSDALSAFRSDALDVLVTNDPYLLLAEQHGGRVIRDGTGLNSDLGLIVASRTALADPAKREAARDVLARLSRATDWCASHVDAYARYFSDDTGLDYQLARVMMRRGSRRVVSVTDALIDRTQSVADDLLRYGFWTRGLDVRPFFYTKLFAA